MAAFQHTERSVSRRESSTPAPVNLLQRTCGCGKRAAGMGTCDRCQKDHLGFQRKGSGQHDAVSIPPSVGEALRSPGQPLDVPTRSFMENGFGHDFSHVRVHADARAGASAHAVNARAYTVGADLVFGPGEYRPHDPSGQRLLAHELAHTVQQAHVSGAAPQASLELGPADDPLEHEADRAAAQVMAASAQERGAGHRLGSALSPMLSLARPVLQRQEKTKPPLIPIPVFDELDPMVIVPDVPGVPSFLRGQKVKLSTLRSALDALRGKLPSLGGPGQDFCARLLAGYETAHGGDVDGMCCPQFVRERGRCCRPQDIGLLSYRCCTPDEVNIDNRCVKPERVPTPAPTPSGPASSFPTLPPLQLPKPEIRFGTIESDTIDHFALNRPETPSTAVAKLNLLASQLKLYSDAEVHVEGHTDSSYTEEYNQRLSEQRAQEVRKALVRRGIDARRIVTQGFGETRLLFPGEANDEEKAKNRRVDVWFYIPPSSRPRSFGERFRLPRPSVEGTEETAP